MNADVLQTTNAVKWLRLKSRFRPGGSRYHLAVAGGPLNDLALSPVFVRLRSGPPATARWYRLPPTGLATFEAKPIRAVPEQVNRKSTRTFPARQRTFQLT